MTEVWHFPRVKGEDRFQHATPKPVDLVRRGIVAACPVGGRVFVPFGGTCPELPVGAETGRAITVIDVEPACVATGLARLEAYTGEKAVKQ